MGAVYYIELFNYAMFVKSEMQASSPYRTGNMQRSIMLVYLDETTIDLVIPVSYASYVNNKGKHKGWVKNVLSRCARAKYGEADTMSADTGLPIEAILLG